MLEFDKLFEAKKLNWLIFQIFGNFERFKPKKLIFTKMRLNENYYKV